MADGLAWVLTEHHTLPTGFEHCAVTMLDGRRFQFAVAPDEWAIHREARTVELLNTLPGPPPEPTQ